MQDSEAPDNDLKLIRLASRLFAAFLLFWAATYITYLPNEILNLENNARNAAIAGSTSWLTAASDSLRYMVLSISATVLRIALCLLAAGWFYRCGPRIQRFFSGADLAPASNPEP